MTKSELATAILSDATQVLSKRDITGLKILMSKRLKSDLQDAYDRIATIKKGGTDEEVASLLKITFTALLHTWGK